MNINDFNLKIARKMITVVDLSEDNLMLKIHDILDKAFIEDQSIASITTFVQHISLIKNTLGAHSPKVISLVNFPSGDLNTPKALDEIHQAFNFGADEIDIVIPYQSIIHNQTMLCKQFLEKVRKLYPEKRYTATLEVGAIESLSLIRKAADVSIRAGFDMIKTATGRHPAEITEPMIAEILDVIKHVNPNVGIHIKTHYNDFEEASKYLELTIEKMGAYWVTPEHFRLSGFKLLESIERVIQNEVQQ